MNIDDAVTEDVAYYVGAMISTSVRAVRRADGELRIVDCTKAREAGQTWEQAVAEAFERDRDPALWKRYRDMGES